MKNSWYKKGIVFGIIILFFGVGAVHAINVNMGPSDIFETDNKPSDSSNDDFETDNKPSDSSNDDLVQNTVKIFGDNGIDEFQVMLSRQQLEEIDILFDKLKIDLENCITEEEVREVYKDNIVSLYEIGAIPEDKSIQEVQDLVTGFNLINDVNKQANYAQRITSNPFKENRFCYITGETTNTGTWTDGVINPIKIFLAMLTTFRLNSDIYFGWWDLKKNPTEDGHAVGWVYTSGTKGVVEWDGSFYGRIDIVFPPHATREYHIGAKLFTGYLLESNMLWGPIPITKYMGFSTWVTMG